MANEVQLQSSPVVPDLTAYFLVRNSSGRVWDTVSLAFVTYVDANQSRYDVALTEEGTSSGYYVGDFPTGITAAGNYHIVAYKQLSITPSVSDLPIGEGDVEWTGSAEAATEPVTLAEAKLWCKVDHDEEDDLISSLIVAARQYAETYTRRSLVQRTKTYKLDGFPTKKDYIELPAPPLLSVTSVFYVDANGDMQTLSTSVYEVEASSEDSNWMPGRVILKFSQSWPATRDQKNAVTINYVAGYSINQDILKAAMKLLICHLWKNRSGAPEQAMLTLPLAVHALLSTMCWGSYC